MASRVILATLAAVFLLSVGVVDAKYYVVHVDKVNWYQALINCYKEGGRLGTVFTPVEQENLAKELQKHAPNDDYFWISLNDLGSNGHYVWWATGVDMTWKNWATNEPKNAQGEDCVAVMRTGMDTAKNIGTWQWNDDTCDQKQAGYICDMENNKQ